MSSSFGDADHLTGGMYFGTQLNHIRPRAQTVQAVCPCLHRLSAFGQILGLVVGTRILSPSRCDSWCSMASRFQPISFSRVNVMCRKPWAVIVSLPNPRLRKATFIVLPDMGRVRVRRPEKQLAGLTMPHMRSTSFTAGYSPKDSVLRALLLGRGNSGIVIALSRQAAHQASNHARHTSCTAWAWHWRLRTGSEA